MMRQLNDSTDLIARITIDPEIRASERSTL